MEVASRKMKFCCSDQQGVEDSAQQPRLAPTVGSPGSKSLRYTSFPTLMLAMNSTVELPSSHWPITYYWTWYPVKRARSVFELEFVPQLDWTDCPLLAYQAGLALNNPNPVSSTTQFVTSTPSNQNRCLSFLLYLRSSYRNTTGIGSKSAAQFCDRQM